MTGRTPPGGGLLPPGRQLAITWSIPDAFGGMTAAMLRRSRSFVRLAGAEVDVLTFDGRPDYPAVRSRLTGLGELVDGVRLHNLYERLRTDAVAPGAIDVEPAVAGTFAAPADTVRRETAPDGAARLEVRSPEGGVRIAHLRADGSLAVLDERERPAAPRRLITAFDADERPVRQWRSARACYAEWIGEVAGVAEGGGAGGDAFAIVDSKTAARFMAHVRMPGLVTLHVVHNAHLEPGTGPLGRLRASRRGVLAHPERFDALVFLTERQRADVATLIADPGNLAVVPNAAAMPAGSGEVDAVADDAARPPAAAAIVAGLTPRKRVDHAVRAIRLARDAGTPVELTVVGDGPELGRLREVVREAGLDGVVEFAGHRADAAEAFAAASVALLTSTSEGAPLVLLEAMARGCIPIAYDIAYGPADLIEHGVNGFLVPPADEAALARAITAVAGLPPLRRAELRREARATASRFDEATVTARWGDAQRAAAERHHRAPEPLDAALEGVRLRRPHGRLRVRARVQGVPDGARATVQLVRRRTGALLRRATTVEAGRVRVRLTREETALLDGGGPIRVALLVEAGDARARLDGGAVHPDTRSLPRRVARRVRPGRPQGG